LAILDDLILDFGFWILDYVANDASKDTGIACRQSKIANQKSKIG